MARIQDLFRKRIEGASQVDDKRKNGGFANNIEKTTDNDFMIIEITQNHTEALENFATATKSDIDAFIRLSLINATL